MKKYLFSAIVLMLLSLFLTSCSNDDENDDLTARTASVFRVVGSEVNINRGDNQTSAQPGVALNPGNNVSTGADSNCYVNLDSSSLVKLDQLSLMSIDRMSDNLISLVVHEGQILVNVHDQDPEHSLETQVGNVVFGVRGTVFIAGFTDDDFIQLIVIEGSVDYENRLITAGRKLVLDDLSGEIIFDDYFNIDELDDFALDALMTHQSPLLPTDPTNDPEDDEDDEQEMYAQDSSDELILAEPYEIDLSDPIVGELNDLFRIFANAYLGDYDESDVQSIDVALMFAIFYAIYVEARAPWENINGTWVEHAAAISYPDYGIVERGEAFGFPLHFEFVSSSHIDFSLQRFFGIENIEHRTIEFFEYEDGRYYVPAANGVNTVFEPGIVELYNNGDGTLTARVNIRVYDWDEFRLDYYNIAIVRPIGDTFQLIYWRSE